MSPDPPSRTADDAPSLRSGLASWGPFLTAPNIITLVRLACVPLFVWLLFGQDDRHGAAWLLAGLGATDWVDGYVARRFNQVSEFGKILDPTADRIMLLVGVLAIAIDGSVPWWFAIATLVREVLVAGTVILLAVLGARRFDVTWWGKCGAFGMMFAYPFFLAANADLNWSSIAEVLAWLCGIPGLIAGYYAVGEYIPKCRDALAEARAEAVDS
ncbi:MAG: CDP-alcohol phosphatidyltransferase family protein [Acidimicrobiales bacterium]|nr:CDP-alcohol phosphatidyltransferase family protein [Acidimicrobiales bacterium]